MADDSEARDPAFDRRLSDARPDGDPLARAVWRSRIAAAMFGEAERVTVGRYRLDRQLGRGGGGSVFVAEDPELHRDVAVKLVRYTSDRHRERALEEGRALARLSHPNVVPVHDVGETAEHVFIVMELLRGESLRAYAAARSVREVVGAYRQAAAGLVAAHAVGLVHRDFKPDNAMFGDDGRLRVVDFGLASDAAAGPAGAVGTPGYMPPEQRDAGPIGPAADQFAFGVSLREAVGQRGSPPAWLARIIARATAEQPADRFASMEALAHALTRDPRSRWTRRALIAVPIALAAAGFGIGRGATTAETCTGGAEALAATWTPARTAAIVAHIEQLDTPFAAAAAPVIRDRVDALGREWLAAHRRSCAAHQRGELSDQLYERATLCLGRSRIGLGAALELLAAAGDERISKAMEAVSGVDRAERCADAVALAAAANPQPTLAMRAVEQQIDRAAIHARLQTSQAIALAQAAVSAARVPGAEALLSRALLALGQAYMADPSTAKRAIDPLHEAWLLAIAAAQDDLVVEAFARHAFVRALSLPGRNALAALDGLEFARAIGQRAGPRGAFGRALLSNNVGGIASGAGDFERARGEFRQSLRDGEAVTGAGAVELTTTLSNLAMLSPDREERRRLFEAALAKVSTAVGPDHPQALTRQLLVVTNREAPRAVVADLPALCGRITRLHPHLGVLAAVCWFELAWQGTAIDDPAAAAAAANAYPQDGPDFKRQLARAYAALAKGPPTAAELAALQALVRAQAAAIPEGAGVPHLDAADGALAVAATARALGNAALTREASARAIEHIERFVTATGVATGVVERRRAWAHQLRGD